MLKEEAGPGKPCWKTPATRAHIVRKLLKLSPISMPAYYRDIYVWQPDVQYDEMPPCPLGCGSAKVCAHAFRSTHLGRRVIELYTCSFIISRRYICHSCKQASRGPRRGATPSRPTWRRRLPRSRPRRC
jgi:hypothetical protein